MNDNVEFVASPPYPRKRYAWRRGWQAMLLTISLLAGARRAEASWALSNAFPNLSFDHPIGLTPEPRSSRLYVNEWDGRIYSFTNDASTTQKTLVLDLSAVTQSSNDCGLMGIVFHPEFGMTNSTNRGYFYVAYCYSPSPVAVPTTETQQYDRLSRFTIPDGSAVADRNSELVLINQFDRMVWHNNSGMFFGADGFLYIGNGDEGGAWDQFNNTQMITNGFFSGVFRIDVDNNPARSHPIRRYLRDGGGIPAGWPTTTNGNYMVPNDNPWLDPSGSILEEFYAIGLRNPYRMTYDPPSGQVWIGDVGQDTEEEIDLLQKAGNYQWAYMEGPIAGPKIKPTTLIGIDTPPVYSYPHNTSRCVIGGYVYRGSQYASTFGGLYFFGDFISGRIWTLQYSSNSPPVIRDVCTLTTGSSFTSFGLDQSNELYACDFLDGKIMRLVQRPDPAPFVARPTLVSGIQAALSFTNYPGLSFSVVSAADPKTPLTNWAWLGPIPEVSPGVYSFTNTAIGAVPAYYRVRQP